MNGRKTNGEMDFYVLYDSYRHIFAALGINGIDRWFSDDLFVLIAIAITISLQCSLIITLLIAILERLPKKK
jgi:hypothetical protein